MTWPSLARSRSLTPEPGETRLHGEVAALSGTDCSITLVCMRSGHPPSPAGPIIPDAPETAAAAAALEFAREYYSPDVLNHAVRSWIWAEHIGAERGIENIDHELLYVAALLHDIGLAPAYDNVALSYEEAGGHVAIALTTGAGWAPERRQRVLNVIVRHNWTSVDVDLDAEGHLLELATGLDVTGANAELVSDELVAAVLADFPRGDFGAEFLACVTDQAERKPDTAASRIAGAGLAAKVTAHPHESRG